MLLAGGENALHRTCMREPTRESESENQVQMAGGQEFGILMMRVVRFWGKVECGREGIAGVVLLLDLGVLFLNRGRVISRSVHPPNRRATFAVSSSQFYVNTNCP